MAHDVEHDTIVLERVAYCMRPHSHARTPKSTDMDLPMNLSIYLHVRTRAC